MCTLKGRWRHLGQRTRRAQPTPRRQRCRPAHPRLTARRRRGGKVDPTHPYPTKGRYRTRSDEPTRLREQSPQGFKLDAEHTPHVTLVQGFVAKQDLPKLLSAVDEVKSRFDLDFDMTATGLYHIPSGKIGLAGIVVAPSERLLALQRAVIDAVDDYTKSGGSESAFVPDKSGAPFDAMAIPYVETFAPKQTGAHYNPHVTIGIAPLDWLVQIEKKPFAKLTFRPKGLAVYQLGNYGTASKRLSPHD